MLNSKLIKHVLCKGELCINRGVNFANSVDCVNGMFSHIGRPVYIFGWIEISLDGINKDHKRYTKINYQLCVNTLECMYVST